MSLKEFCSVRKCLKHPSLKAAKVLLSRLLFMAFGIVVIWYLSVIVNGWDSQAWYFILLLLPLIAESIYALYSKDHNQTKWFMPHVLFFLIAALPPMWLLETDLINKIDNESAEVDRNCSTTRILNQSDGVGLLEQAFIFIIILSKWLLPKQKMTLDELSQLLLANIAAGADIVEFIHPLKDNDCELIRKQETLLFFVGVATAWSLLQFPFNLSAKKNPSSKYCNFYCFHNETWALLLCILFQDGPFLIIRLVILFHYRFLSSANFFFAMKNLFVILLDLNRIRAIYKKQRQTWHPRMMINSNIDDTKIKVSDTSDEIMTYDNPTPSE